MKEEAVDYDGINEEKYSQDQIYELILVPVSLNTIKGIPDKKRYSLSDILKLLPEGSVVSDDVDGVFGIVINRYDL